MTDSELLVLLRQSCGYAKKANGNWIMVACPTCSPKDAKKHKRGVNLQTLSTNCFICEIPLTIHALLGGLKFERVERTVVEEQEHPQAKELPCLGYIPINQLDDTHPAVKFLYKDSLYELDKYWEENEIGFIPKEGAVDLIFPKGKINTANALVFPVRFKNELVGWQLRFIPDYRMHKLKYLHLFKKGNYLYNYDNVKSSDIVVVVEGVKKALKLPNAVATLGKGITDEQIQRLLHWKKIVFLYDSEEATQQKAEELVEHFISGGRKCININPGTYGFPSPDEMTAHVAQQIVKTKCLENGFIEDGR